MSLYSVPNISVDPQHGERMETWALRTCLLCFASALRRWCGVLRVGARAYHMAMAGDHRMCFWCVRRTDSRLLEGVLVGLFAGLTIR
jgi:hypothetical protein